MDSHGMLRSAWHCVAATGIVIAVILFNFAVIGVFGLPCAIASSVAGIVFSIATVIVTNNRADRGLK
jgi:hypothetical protein